LRDTVACLIRIPFFWFPLLIHLPAYAASRYAAKLAEDEEETQAQNKIVVGLILLLLIYPTAFFVLWALFWKTPTGALIAAATVWLLAVYHVRIIDGKRLSLTILW
jgi:glycerol-3-phosphate O-acyltransferase/dihydroxyacetone phosphate acyltransferase